MRTVFEELVAPLNQFFEDKGSQIDKQAGSKSLFFSDFLLKLILAHVMKFSSLRILTTELSSNESVKKQGFKPTPFSTLKEGFSRFKAQYFQQAFEWVLKSGNWLSIPGIE